MDVSKGDIFDTGAGGASAYTQSGGTTQVDGTLATSSVNVDGGVLKGTGAVDGNVVVAGGTVAPGDSPGTLTVNGNYSQNADGTLSIVLAGGTAGSGFSVLDVSGTVTLSGALDLTSLNLFNPFAGEKFDIVNFGAGDESGRFSLETWSNLTAGLTFSLLYNPTDVEVIVAGPAVSAAPETATWLLFAGGLGSMVGFQMARRRRAALRV